MPLPVGGLQLCEMMRNKEPGVLLGFIGVEGALDGIASHALAPLDFACWIHDSPSALMIACLGRVFNIGDADFTRTVIEPVSKNVVIDHQMIDRPSGLVWE